MSNWGDGYKQGHKDALEKVTYLIEKLRLANTQIADPSKDANGTPSLYAVANKCCGGVDAHCVGCTRR